MAADSGKMSRRDLLFGSVRRLRKNAEAAADLTTDNSPLKPGKPKVTMLELGEDALRSGELDKAVRRLRECVQADFNDADARLALGEALYRMGKHVQARVELERAMRLRPKDNLARLYLGLALLRMGRADKARTVWEDYFDPENLELQREISVQLAYLESEEELDLPGIADTVERVAGVAGVAEDG
jgi:tetratricopeptide (TPR) repeat protein